MSRIAAIDVPGFEYFFSGTPLGGEQKEVEKQLGDEVVSLFEDKLMHYQLRRQVRETNSGKKALHGISIQVDNGKVDEMISIMWKCICLAESKHIEMMDKIETTKSLEAENLEDKVLDVARPESADDI